LEEKRVRVTLLAVLVAAVCAAVPVQSRAAPLDDVLNTDRAFAAAALRDGARAAFVAYAAPDAMMFRDGVGPVKGQAAIAGSFRASGGAIPDWAPEGGEIAKSGELAYTWGYFRWTASDGSGKQSTGNYVSIWRKIEGEWKWIVDLGVQAPPK
jgi:ketosteroid isomerase-like protein